MQMIRLAALVGVIGAGALGVACKKEQPAQQPMGMQQQPTNGAIPGADPGTGTATTATPTGTVAPAASTAAPAASIARRGRRGER